MLASDRTAELTDRILNARAQGSKLTIVGAGSKRCARIGAQGDPLRTAEHMGVLDYRPEELVVTARGGTPLVELMALLAEHRQYLPFEPPLFSGQGTLGGAVACGWAGPGRPWRGSVRDAVLGVEMLNGLGERLVFGGQVMKNVAGYDLSRLQAGAWGTLGLLLSISVRLLPMPEAEETRALECTAQASQQLARRWARSSLPVSATGYWQGTLYLRLSGSASSLRKAAAELGGESTPDSTIWQRLRDRTLPWFAQRPGSVLWELLCPPATTLPVGECAIEWAGARRWWRTNLPSHEVHADAVRIGARAVRPDAPPLLDGLMSGRLKCAFDPDNVLNSHILSSPAESSHV